MQKDPAPEFDLQRPFASALAVILTVLFSPKSFYLNFKVEGPIKEPAAQAKRHDYRQRDYRGEVPETHVPRQERERRDGDYLSRQYRG